jgi:hypothetical protein
MVRHRISIVCSALAALVACTGGHHAPPASSDPGRVTLHRLNRAEYNNTVRDLLHTRLRPADDFPADDFGYGFDNIADVLSISPLHVEMYERAAHQVLDEALEAPIRAPQSFRIEAEDAEASTGGAHAQGWNLWSNGSLSVTLNLPRSNEYRISVRAFGHQAGPDPVRMAVLADGVELSLFDVLAEGGNFEIYELEAELSRGLHQISVGFVNDYFFSPSQDRNLIVDWFRVEGPLRGLPESNPARSALLTCNPEAMGSVACARSILESFTPRAWRRPVEPAEIDVLLALVRAAEDDGQDFETGLKVALSAVLMSPHFVFRVELDPDPHSATPHRLDAWELASRLSYFLWSSMPDDELFGLAEEGRLDDPEVLAAQTRRMLADPKAEALVDNFAGNWLMFRALDDAAPDLWSFPAWNEELRASMRQEMRLFFASIVAGERGMLELLTARESYIDPPLAEHYGLPEPAQPGFHLSSTEGSGRSGILGQAGLLTALSYPTRTSPVLRGKWVLGQLLCAEPDPPPPGVEGLIDQGGTGGSLRERLEEHRANPDCAVCHDAMDAIGFGLENFDGIGRWRDQDEGFHIDASGSLPGVGSWDGPEGLAHIVASHQDLPRCIARNLFFYGLGRGPMGGDGPFIDAITEAFVDAGHRFEDLAVAIVTSDPFRMRRGEGAKR